MVKNWIKKETKIKQGFQMKRFKNLVRLII